MAGFRRDAYYTQLPSELPRGYEAGFETIGREPVPEWHIPLRWVMASIGGLSLISLGIGLVLQWLLR
jgi:hypothetical protein